MQDPSVVYPEHEHLKCPRCDSANTKFCYYNNYNLSQPRHFCKNCRRYWTKGGTLRNVPVGGGTRKTNGTKRTTPSSPTADHPPPPSKRPAPDVENHTKNGEETLLSLNFGDFSEGHLIDGFVDPGQVQTVDPDPEEEDEEGKNEGWSGNSNNAWPDLSIYTPPGSNFH